MKAKTTNEKIESILGLFDLHAAHHQERADRYKEKQTYDRWCEETSLADAFRFAASILRKEFKNVEAD